MGQEYALTRRSMINQIHSLHPQPVIEFISYRLEVIGSTGGAAFITPRSPVRSRPPLPTALLLSKKLKDSLNSGDFLFYRDSVQDEKNLGRSLGRLSLSWNQ